MVYRLPGCRLDARSLALRLDREPAADVVLFMEGGEAVARRDREELRFVPAPGGFAVSGDPEILDVDHYPDGLERAWRALACGRAGEIVVSAAEGWEFADLGGRHHLGGGSHGSLVAGDSIVPVIAVGLEGDGLPDRPGIVDLAPAALSHFGLARPPSMERAVAAHA